MIYVLLAMAIALVSVSAALLVPFFFQWLAEENIFFTTVKEGTVKTVMRGKQFERHIMAFEDYRLNDPSKKNPTDWYNPNLPDWEVVYNKDRTKSYDDRPALLKHLGLHWVGWPWAHSVYVYQFEWNETHTDEKGNERVLRRAEATDFIFVSDFTYAIVTEGAETKDRLPTDELTLVTVAIRNPYRALFSGVDWMRRVTAAVNRSVRQFVGNKLFEELITMDEFQDFSGPIIGLTNSLPDDPAEKKTSDDTKGNSSDDAEEVSSDDVKKSDSPPAPRGLRGRYGVEIRTADLQTVELSGEGDMKRRSEEATTKKYVAEQEAEAIKVAGKAAAEVIIMTGDATAKSLQKRLNVIEGAGPTGELLAQLDAMQEAAKGAGNTVIWANNPLVQLPKKGETES